MHRIATFALGAFALAASLALPAGAQQPAAPAGTDTVAAIRARGTLICGVAPSTAGFSLPDSRGEWRGLDVDTCRTVAAALLGDATKVRFVPSSTQQRFTMLQSGEIDMLVRSTTWTLGREASLGLSFAGVNFYDGQGFMVRTNSGVTSARGLDGATVCVQPGTTTELNLADYFRTNNMRFTPVVIENVEELRAAFRSGRCDAYTNDASSLAAFRAAEGPAGEQYTLLPELISKEPLGPVVRKGDARFFDIVRWSLFAQQTAEELGITSQNLATFNDSTNPDVQRFMGRSGDLGRQLGLDNEWAQRIVRQVGNFSEMWERNITPLGIPRGANNLWNRGGLHYPPPMR
ncbi:amino acid ABC transporter substrate-binding protein [Roseomonas hellenica]|uniref:Amino acid ABC transporter substrate-binding protein n=1 Tax=Plastoroseomonas hellenica TaxID=2687306 RepID=A0ABS5F8N0_9PROT|nr:amino acid ABC transporter substrate-binding protein [Plastoroseomonas hellenica]MBR0668896.1 amino acid ABC transporter substrate-binding protein [Plastoroseomonas hellenica]